MNTLRFVVVLTEAVSQLSLLASAGEGISWSQLLSENPVEEASATHSLQSMTW